MARELQYLTERDQVLARLLDSGLEPGALERSADLINDRLAAMFFRNREATPNERARLLGWLLRQLAVSPRSENWISEENRVALEVWAGLRAGSPRNPADRWRVLGRYLAGPHKDGLTERQMRRRRPIIINEISGALFDRLKNNTDLLNSLAKRWIGAPNSSAGKYAAGHHPRGQFRTLSVNWRYQLAANELPTEFEDSRMLLPILRDIEYWSFQVWYSGGNHALVPSVEGAELLGIIEDEALFNYRRYLVRFYKILDRGDDPISITIRFKYTKNQSTAPLPILSLASEIPLDAEVDLTVEFFRSPRRPVYELYCPTTAIPHPPSDDPVSYVQVVEANDDGVTYHGHRDHLASGYSLSLYWPSDIDIAL